MLPVTLRIAVGLLWLQGLAMVGLGIALVVWDLTGHPDEFWAGITEAVVSVLIGLLFGVLGYALVRGHRAARTPAIVLELTLLPIGYFMISSSVVWEGVLAIVLGVAVTGLLVTPSVRDSLGIH